MHGRLKVKTSEEKKIAMKAEKKRRNIHFHTLVSKLWEKRRSNEATALFYTSSTLEEIAVILHLAPEWTALWNLRRIILLHLFNNTQPKENEEENSGDNDGETNKPSPRDLLLYKELSLTMACLQENPKAYPVWHHRGWSMAHMEKPNWTEEMRLCTHALERDERNFHCWDYRRWVAEHSAWPRSEEVDFTRQKIRDFSNFSSWHYRHTLLEVENQVDIGKELDLVHNAVFTDPSDQSAWFYYRWPLGKVKKPLEVLAPELLYFSQDRTLLAVFPNPVSHSVVVDLVQLSGVDESLQWTAPISGCYSALWSCTLPSLDSGTSQINIQLRLPTPGTEEIYPIPHSSTDNVIIVRPGQPRTSAALMEILRGESEVMKELLQEEPENKWVLLTCLQLEMDLQGDESRPDNSKEIESMFTTLEAADPSHGAYYHDLRSRWLVERSIELTSVLSSSLSMADLRLTSVHYGLHRLSWLRRLDISGNQLRHLPEELAYLLCLEELNVAQNQLQTVRNVEKVHRLRRLDLCGNHLWNVAEFNKVFLQSGMATLEMVLLKSNPILEAPQFKEMILPQLTFTCIFE